MSKQDWNKRYSSEEYIYGTEPNEFFRQQIDLMDTGKLLLPGEGRNAVYAASKWRLVDAIDSCTTAKEIEPNEGNYQKSKAYVNRFVGKKK